MKNESKVHEPLPTYKSIEEGKIGDKDAHAYGSDTKDILTKGHKRLNHHSIGHQAEAEYEQAQASYPPRDIESEHEPVDLDKSVPHKNSPEKMEKNFKKKEESLEKKGQPSKGEDDPNGLIFDAPKPGKPFPDELESGDAQASTTKA